MTGTTISSKIRQGPSGRSRSTLLDTELLAVPNMDMLRLSFVLETSSEDSPEKRDAEETLICLIKDNDMASYYKYLCESSLTTWSFDSALYDTLLAKNKAKLADFDARLEDAKENLGFTDVFEVLTEKSLYLARALDKEESLSALRMLQEKTVTTGSKLDIIFCQLRIAFLFRDFDLAIQNVEKANDLVDSSNLETGGADWERRNRFKVYKAMMALWKRDIPLASDLFIETLATFNFTELITMEQLALYCSLTSLLKMPRVAFSSKVLASPEIAECMESLPILRMFCHSIYNCEYSLFFESLANLESSLFRTDPWLFRHRHYFSKEFRVLAFKQFLSSYQSVDIRVMAQTFGVTTSWLDKELFNWISAGRLNCLMDKVSGTIQMNQYRTLNSHKNSLYDNILKDGDALLNRLQKLGRVVNI